MAINGISTQQVSGISPNAGVSANGGASIESVSNAISAAANKGITPAGPTVTERDSRGSTYGFTPYHDHNGNKMVYLESRSASGVVSHMPLKFEQLESLCSRRGIAVPSLQYNLGVDHGKEQRTARSAFGRIERMFGGAVGHRGEARSGRAFLGGPDGCRTTGNRGSRQTGGAL